MHERNLPREGGRRRIGGRPGSLPDPARFPSPSTVAGCLRTAWARETGRPFGPELARLTVAGPLLLDRENRILAPKPADALYFGHGGSARCLRAEPEAFEPGCGADLPEALLPVRLTEHVEGKPGSGPAWWSWEDLLAFRRSGETAARRSGNGRPPPSREDGRPDGVVPPDADAAEAGRILYERLCENGWSPPRGDRRTHVAIDPSTGAADTGRLFQTEGLDLDTPTAPRDRGSPPGEGSWPASSAM